MQHVIVDEYDAYEEEPSRLARLRRALSTAIGAVVAVSLLVAVGVWFYRLENTWLALRLMRRTGRDARDGWHPAEQPNQRLLLEVGAQPGGLRLDVCAKLCEQSVLIPSKACMDTWRRCLPATEHRWKR